MSSEHQPYSIGQRPVASEQYNTSNSDFVGRMSNDTPPSDGKPVTRRIHIVRYPPPEHRHQSRASAHAYSSITLSRSNTAACEGSVSASRPHFNHVSPLVPLHHSAIRRPQMSEQDESQTNEQPADYSTFKAYICPSKVITNSRIESPSHDKQRHRKYTITGLKTRPEAQ